MGNRVVNSFKFDLGQLPIQKYAETSNIQINTGYD